MTKQEFWKCYMNDDFDPIVALIRKYQCEDPWKWYDGICLELGLMYWSDEDEFQRNLDIKTVLMAYIFNVDPDILNDDDIEVIMPDKED